MKVLDFSSNLPKKYMFSLDKVVEEKVGVSGVQTLRLIEKNDERSSFRILSRVPRR